MMETKFGELNKHDTFMKDNQFYRKADNAWSKDKGEAMDCNGQFRTFKNNQIVEKIID